MARGVFREEPVPRVVVSDVAAGRGGAQAPGAQGGGNALRCLGVDVGDLGWKEKKKKERRRRKRKRERRSKFLSV